MDIITLVLRGPSHMPSFDETRQDRASASTAELREAHGRASDVSPPPARPTVDLTGGVRSITDPPMLLTVRDVEAELQLGRTRTYELIRSGQIPVIRLGRSVRVPREALRRWIDETCVAANPG